MKHTSLILFLAAVLGLSGCEGVYLGAHPAADVVYQEGRPGPPPWAPAHGYRHKVRYRYYPNQEVYRNIDSGQYVWLEHGAWRFGYRLPDYIRLGNSVIVDIDGDHPNLYHRQIVTVYPPRVRYRPEPRRDYGREDHGRDEKRPEYRAPERREDEHRSGEHQSEGRREGGDRDGHDKGRGNGHDNGRH